MNKERGLTTVEQLVNKERGVHGLSIQKSRRTTGKSGLTTALIESLNIKLSLMPYLFIHYFIKFNNRFYLTI